MLAKIVLTSFLLTTPLVGDYLVQISEDNHLLKAIIDNGTHSIIGGLIWCIICVHKRNSLFLHENIWEIFLCLVFASMIDVDHFIAAKSIRLQDVHLLKSRPFLHNTTLTTLIWILILITSYINKSQIVHTISWIFFAAFVSHHTRDATRRGYWWFPLGSTPPINYWIYISITLIMPFAIIYAMSVVKLQKTHESYNLLEV